MRIDLAAAPVSLAGIGRLPASCAGDATAAAIDRTASDVGDISIVDFAFTPASLEVAAGTTVIWTNADWPPHTVTAGDESFDSGRIDAGGTFSQKFEAPGEYRYHCVFHPLMVGTVMVG